jgi:hypothetical protein
MYRDPACRGLGHPNPVRHHLLHALADGYAKGGAAVRKSRIPMLTLIRGVHSVIYIILAAGVCLLLFAALTAYSGPLVITAAMAVAIEVTVFTANGFQCPLTNLAREYGAEEGNGYAFDTVLPERITRRTFRMFGILLALGITCFLPRFLACCGPCALRQRAVCPFNPYVIALAAAIFVAIRRASSLVSNFAAERRMGRRAAPRFNI